MAKGDVVRLATKPAVTGRVLWFLVPRVVHGEGCYSHGKVQGSADFARRMRAGQTGQRGVLNARCAPGPQQQCSGVAFRAIWGAGVAVVSPLRAQVCVNALPAEVYGDGARHTWPIRRIECVVGKTELAEHAAREMQKVWTAAMLVPRCCLPRARAALGSSRRAHASC